MKKNKIIVIVLFCALLVVLTCIFLGKELLKSGKNYDEVRTTCNGVQILVPAGWEMDKTKTGCYSLNKITYNKFAFNLLGYSDLEYNLARIHGSTQCGADKAQYIYDRFFKYPEKTPQAEKENIPKAYLGRGEELISYSGTYGTINNAKTYSEFYIIKRLSAKGLVNEFNWDITFYTPDFGLHLFASCLEKHRPQFEPVFSTIFNSVVLPQNKFCN